MLNIEDWLGVTFLVAVVAIVLGYAYDSYQEHETKREALRTIQVLVQEGLPRDKALDVIEDVFKVKDTE